MSKILVFAIALLFTVLSIVPASSFSIDEEYSEEATKAIEESSYSMPYDDVHNPDLGEGLLESYDDIDRELDERWQYIREDSFPEFLDEDTDKDLYDEFYPSHFRYNLWNHSDYPFDESFLDYPDYDEFGDMYRQRFNDEYVKNHTLKDRKPTPKPNFANGKTLYVGGSGPSNYSKIQDAIDAANNGDTVYVYNGTYHENIRLDKTINLFGDEKKTTIIVGNGKYHAVTISNDGVGVKICGFTIQCSGFYWSGAAGIAVYSNWCAISENIITNSSLGVQIYYSSFNKIINNTIKSNELSGLMLERSCYNIINANFISSNREEGGIGIISSDNNTISGNIIRDHNNTGIYIARSKDNNIIGNDVINIKEEGLRLWNSDYNNLLDNNFVNCGLFVIGSRHNVVSNNTVNGNPLVYLAGESEKIIDYGAGQIILIGCEYITIENQVLTNTSVGIELCDCNNCIVQNNCISNSYYGIFISAPWTYSEGIKLFSNYILNNDYGIWSRDLGNSIISSNIISNNNEFGIYFCARTGRNTISENIITNNKAGIYMSSSGVNIISNNNISNNEQGGIELIAGGADSIIYNTIRNNGRGISLIYSGHITITDNTFCSNGINIKGPDLIHWNTHTIENNVANEKPIYYYKNIHGGLITSKPAQVILANCTHFRVQNLTFMDVDVGIQLGFSFNNEIVGNIIINKNDDGIYLSGSSYNNVTNNHINDHNEIGIYLINSSNNNIFHNTITNGGHGIYLLSYSVNNRISENAITNNDGDGVYLEYYSTDNTITGNNISNNGQGVQLISSNGNRIIDNICNLNFRKGFVIKDSSSNVISNCTIRNHPLSGILMEGDSMGNLIQDCYISQNWRGIEIDSYSMSNEIISCSVTKNYWGIKLSDSTDNTIEKCTISDNACGIMRGKNNIIRMNNFIDNKVFHAFGELKHKNFWNRNYWSGHNTPLPYYLYGLNVDWFPRAVPYDYDYPESYDISGIDSNNDMWDWDEETLYEREDEKLDMCFYMRDRTKDLYNYDFQRPKSWFDGDKLSYYPDSEDYLMDIWGEIN